MGGRSRFRPVRHRRHRSPHDQHLCLDCRAAEAGPVGIERVIGRAAVVVEGFERELALASVSHVPVEAAAILLAGAIDAGDGARTSIDLILPRHQAEREIGQAALIEEALLAERAAADEVIKQPPVVFEVEGRTVVFQTGVEAGELHAKLAHLGAWPEGARRGDRCAVGEPHDRVFRVVAVGGLHRL